MRKQCRTLLLIGALLAVIIYNITRLTNSSHSWDSHAIKFDPTMVFNPDSQAAARNAATGDGGGQSTAGAANINDRQAQLGQNSAEGKPAEVHTAVLSVEEREAARMLALRANESLPLVFFDVEIKVRPSRLSIWVLFFSRIYPYICP